MTRNQKFINSYSPKKGGIIIYNNQTIVKSMRLSFYQAALLAAGAQATETDVVTNAVIDIQKPVEQISYFPDMLVQTASLVDFFFPFVHEEGDQAVSLLAQVDAESKVDVDTFANTKVEGEAELNAEAKIELDADVESESELEAALEIDSEAEVESEAESAIEVDSDAELEVESESGNESEAESEAEAEVDLGS